MNNTWLIDAYRNNNKIVLWLKEGEKNIRLERDFKSTIYAEDCEKTKQFLDEEGVAYRIVERMTYVRTPIKVVEIVINKIDYFERFISEFEMYTEHRVPLYNADIPPEQMYLYGHDLRPCWQVEEVNGKLVRLPESTLPDLTVMKMKVILSGPISTDSPLHACVIDGVRKPGTEREVLEYIVEAFRKKDPDIILLDFAFSRLPYLEKRMNHYGIASPFHRWDKKPIRYKGGRSFFTYGQVRYSDFAVRLNGRFLIDALSTVGQECDPDSISELAQLTGFRFQHIASRSFGAAFQQSLVRIMIEKGYLVPFKEKPLDVPLSMSQLVKADRAGHTLDAKIGFHTDVAAIDFTSLYPWLIFNHNISAETILSNDGPFESAPGIPVRASLRQKGIIPQAIKPIIDRRMYYKRNPTSINRRRAAGLKWILVTSYGYLRFREFKLGLASSHMAIGGYAREIMIKALNMAEKRGFEVVHGIIDSLYITKPGITEKDAKDFCADLELETGVPVAFDGLMKWAVFLPSVNDAQRPLPAKYYGVFYNGEIKARGLEVRQRSAPLVVKHYQEGVLEIMARCNTADEIRERVPQFGKLMRIVISQLPNMGAAELSCNIRISQPDYKHNIPQKHILRELRKKGYNPEPGHTISFVHAMRGAVLPEVYENEQLKPNVEKYTRLLVRSLFAVIQPFGFSKCSVEALSKEEHQLSLKSWLCPEMHTTEPLKIKKMHMLPNYAQKTMEKGKEALPWSYQTARDTS